MPLSPSTIGSQKRRNGAVQRTALTLGLILTAAIVPLSVYAASSELLPVVIQKDILPKHRILADRVLRALPSSCRKNLKNFYVNYEKKPANRGLGGESTIIVTGNVPDHEFMALVTHECGHVSDLGGLRGSDIGQKTFFSDGSAPIYGDDPSMRFYEISWLSPVMMQPNSKESDFVSGYAESDPFEDFAESYAYYALQQREFARIAANNPILKAKYDFMANVVFAGKSIIASGQHKRGNRVPWDVTKLPYVWHAKR